MATVTTTITTALQSDILADSIGVNTHFEEFTPGSAYNQPAIFVPLMQNLGVRYYRAGLDAPGGDSPPHKAQFDAAQVSMANIGCQAIYVIGSQGAVYDYSLLEARYTALGSNARWMSGWNEPTVSVGNVAAMNTAITDLYNAVKASALLSPIVDVVSPGFTGGGKSGFFPSGISDIDIGDWHTYQHSAWPENPSTVPLTGYLADYSIYIPTSKFVTETGYTSAMLQSGIAPVPQDIVARYMPRLYLFYMQSGILRTWYHELCDEHAPPAIDSNSGFGLCTYAGVPKPAYYAMQSLIELFSDPGPTFTPAPVNITIKTPVAIKTAMFQKRDGTNLLCLWQGVSSWSNEAQQNLYIINPPIIASVQVAATNPRVIVFNDDGSTSTTNAIVSTKMAPSTMINLGPTVPDLGILPVTDALTVVQF